jgi:hypothetical protein
MSDPTIDARCLALHNHPLWATGGYKGRVRTHTDNVNRSATVRAGIVAVKQWMAEGQP